MMEKKLMSSKIANIWTETRIGFDFCIFNLFLDPLISEKSQIELQKVPGFFIVHFNIFSYWKGNANTMDIA